MRRTLALAFFSVAIASPAAAFDWSVVPTKSSIVFGGVYAGNAFKGEVSQWTAAIQLDPARLAAATVRVTVASAGVRTGDKFQDTTLAGAEWFAPAQFPRVIFSAQRIISTGPGKYVAQGVLTVKGKAVPVQLPFTLKIAGSVATMHGTATLDRTALGLGALSDPTGAWVSKLITVTVDLTATHK